MKVERLALGLAAVVNNNPIERSKIQPLDLEPSCCD